MKCATKCSLNSSKVEMEFGATLLNHTLAGPLSVVGSALHMISFGNPCKCIRVLNDSRWSSGSLDSLYVSTCGIQNLTGRGRKVTCTVKGELVRWTSLSRLVYTHPLMASIIISIFSFIVYMSYAMHIVPFSNSDGRLASFYQSHLLAVLISS